MNDIRTAPSKGDEASEGMLDFQRYRSLYERNEADFYDAVEGYGLPFESCETQPRGLRLASGGGWRCRNCSESLVRGWISPACERCRTGENMESFFISLSCPKQCWFCFNDNQEDAAYHRQHRRDVASELRQAYEDGRRLDFIALTGGEPCLFPDDVASALREARKCFPESHLRLYTSGAGADEAIMDEFVQAGLNEVRFSIKLDDGPEEYRRLLSLMSHCIRHLDTLVEMPVEPHNMERMKGILIDLEDIGVRGINLLELCYPLANAEEYASRDLMIRRPPYKVVYDYWYAGKFPVAGSETDALELLRFADRRSLSLGVHYCSFDNKNSGQLYLQNSRLGRDAVLQESFPQHSFDDEDFFIKVVKVFGVEAAEMREVAGREHVRTSASAVELDGRSVEFFEVSRAGAAKLRPCLPDAVFAISLNVMEPREGAWAVREVAVREMP